jgi:hypothetical protein
MYKLHLTFKKKIKVNTVFKFEDIGCSDFVTTSHTIYTVTYWLPVLQKCNFE